MSYLLNCLSSLMGNPNCFRPYLWITSGVGTEVCTKSVVRSVVGLLASLFLFFGVSYATPSIFVAYPPNHHRVKHTHVILEGSVTAGARLRISGQSVQVGSDGLFMLWWPLQEGLNRLDMLATQHGQSKRKTLHITRVVPRPLAATPTRIRANSVRPHQALEFWDPAADSLKEREVTFRFEGSRAGRAQLQIGDMSPQVMPEVSAGVYSKTLTIPAHSAIHDTTHNPWRAAPVRFYLTGQDGKTLSATASTISVLPEIGPRLGTQKAESVEGLGMNSALSRVLDLDGRPLLYPAANTQYKVVGREGEFFRVRLQKGQSGLVASQHIDLATVPPKTLSGGVVEIDVGAEDTTDHVIRLRVGVHGGKVPFRVQQLEPQKLLLTLYGLERAPVLGMPLDGSLGADVLHRLGLRSVRVKQEQTEHKQAHQILIELVKPQLWGFYAHYADQNVANHSARASDDILLTLRTSASSSAPISVPTPAAPATLSGRVITIDAGHGGIHKGGAGSLRVPEKGLVLPIALQVAEKLRKWGATVHLTRTEDVTLGLHERVLLAEQTQSELLVSLHANALPDGVDPRGIRGPEVYFSHEQARPAATAILKQLRLGLPEIGHGKGLRPDADFALTRPTAQISLLVELGYLTDPQNLRTLHSASGQARFAEAVALGIRDFFEAASQGSSGGF